MRRGTDRQTDTLDVSNQYTFRVVYDSREMKLGSIRQTPFIGLFFRTSLVSRHQKGETILDFNEARDDGIAVASAGPDANHLHLAADR